MNIWIQSLACSAIGALAVTTSVPAFAAGECVTVAHDITSGEKLNLDPARSTGLDGAGLNVTIYESLVDLDNSFQVVPRLAKLFHKAHHDDSAPISDGSQFGPALAIVLAACQPRRIQP